MLQLLNDESIARAQREMNTVGGYGYGYFAPAQPRIPYTPPTQIIHSDTMLTRARAIAEMYEKKLVTKTEARKLLAGLDPAFARVLSD